MFLKRVSQPDLCTLLCNWKLLNILLQDHVTNQDTLAPTGERPDLGQEAETEMGGLAMSQGLLA